MHPILLDFSDHFETERLLLRAPRTGDGAQVHAAVVETLGNLRRWPDSLPWAVHEPSVEASERFCRTGQATFVARTDLPLLIFSREDGSLIGCTGLHRMDWSVPRFEIGYWCRASREGQGLISEAVRGVAGFACRELGARRLEILQNSANTRSRRVAERSGFTLEGILRHHRRDGDGEPADTSVYALLA